MSPKEKEVDLVLPESPLLNAKPPKARSTINLDKLDKARFTNIKATEKDGNSLRIILFVVVIIIVGVAAALLVRQLVMNNESAQDVVLETEDEVDTVSNFVVSTNVVADSLASKVPVNEDFDDAALTTIGSSSVDVSTVTLNRIEYSRFTTFARMIFVLENVNDTLPVVNLSYDSLKDMLTLEVPELSNISEELKVDREINDIVSEYRFDSVNSKMILVFSQTTLYQVEMDNDSLIIYLRTQDEVEEIANNPVEEEEETEEEVVPDTSEDTTEDTSSDRPAAPFYENEFSQNTQYVSSAVTTNDISLSTYAAGDVGTFFELSWSPVTGLLGDDYVPNAKAYMMEEDGTSYIYVEIENLSRAILSSGLTASRIETDLGFTMSGANFVEMTQESFDLETGKAVYKIELKQKADFKLLTQPSFAEDTQILSIQIKD